MSQRRLVQGVIMVIETRHTIMVKISDVKLHYFEILHTESHSTRQLSIKLITRYWEFFQHIHVCIILLSEFHVNCLEPWLDDKQSCPVCRRQIGKETDFTNLSVGLNSA